jgi:hypothetical protein
MAMFRKPLLINTAMPAAGFVVELMVNPFKSSVTPLARVRQPTREISEFSPCGLRKCLSPRECSPQTSL